MKVLVCGSRGSLPATGANQMRYGGETSCIAISRHDGERPDLLIDAGTGVRTVDSVLDGEPFRGSVLLGHLHWDHIQGIPFFRSGDREGARVDVYAPGQPDEPEAAIARMMSPPTFPITPGELVGDWTFRSLEEGEHDIEGYSVTALEIPHKGGRTYGYRVSNGSDSVAYLSDHHPAGLGPGPDGHGVLHDAALTLARDVDLLIHDAQFVGDEWPDRMPFGHSTPTYAVGLARAAGASSLLLFHHDHLRTDDELDELAAWCESQATPRVTVARQGMMLDVGSA